MSSPGREVAQGTGFDAPRPDSPTASLRSWSSGAEVCGSNNTSGHSGLESQYTYEHSTSTEAISLWATSRELDEWKSRALDADKTIGEAEDRDKARVYDLKPSQKMPEHETNPETVNHLISDRVGGMVLDKTREVWVKDSMPSEDDLDPFADIPDLDVDQVEEQRWPHLVSAADVDDADESWSEGSLMTMNPFKELRMPNERVELQKIHHGQSGSTLAADVHDADESEGNASAQFSVRNADSNTFDSTLFSERSREQPTDPSSWLNSLSIDFDEMGGHATNDKTDGKLEKLRREEEVEDCSRSISSVADSIGSAVSTEGSLGQASVNYVVAKFTQSDSDLLALYTHACHILTRTRFVDNNRRLLKRFYIELAHEERSPAQREAVAFLKSRRTRAAISLDIFRTVTPDDEIVSCVEHEPKFLLLNLYLESLDTADANRNVEDDQQSLESHTTEFEDLGDKPSLDMTRLQATGEFFVTSRAFSRYKQRLDDFLHQSAFNHPDMESKQPAELSETSDVPAMVYNKDAEYLLRDVREEDSLSGERVAEHSLNDTLPDVKSAHNAHESVARLSEIEGGSMSMTWERESFLTWVTKWATDTMRPPSKGSERVWYLCGCGQHTYIDVKELEPGGVDSEWRSITESSAAARRAHSPQSSAYAGDQHVSAPPPAHLSPRISGRNTTSSNSPSGPVPMIPHQMPRPSTYPASLATTPGPSVTSQRSPMFLLICINGKAYKTMAELRCLDIDDSYNDERLIRGIYDQYKQAREGYHWTIASLVPGWIRTGGLIQQLTKKWGTTFSSGVSAVRDTVLVRSISEWWSEWAPHISLWAPLHIIDTADFVEFELVPHPEGKDAFPSHFTPDCWPSPDNKQYRYRPAPMKCIKRMNLWHMCRPGPHTEVYWFNTVPKKVDGALYRPAGTAEDVVGYGVRINERLNDVLVLCWSLIFVLGTGLFIYVYARCTSDNSSALGLGAYLMAVFMVYIQLQYAVWKRA